MTQPHFVSLLVARKRQFALLFLMMVPLGVSGALSSEPVPQQTYSVPSPALDPAEVVRIQVEALRKNSISNEGLELTYRFASPGNKRYTGPLDRFTEMVRSAPYDQLLNHRSAEYSPMAVSGNEAQQVVIIVDAGGEEVAYLWVLSRQTEGAFKNCWMTDAVIPAKRAAQWQLTQRFISTERLSAVSTQLRFVFGKLVARMADG